MTDEQSRNLALLRAADPDTTLVGTDQDGTLVVEHCPKEEKLGRQVGGELQKPMGVSRTFVYRIHPNGERCGWGWAACTACGTALMAGDRTLELPVALDGRRINHSEAGSYRGVIKPKKGARWGEVAQASNVFFDGSDEEVRAHLEEMFGTPAFSLVGHAIELELPLVGRDWRPRPSGETVLVRFSAPSSWSVQAPEQGRWWHVVPEAGGDTLCTIRLSTWTTTAVRDDDHPISCPWCRARMIAIEIAAPPAEVAPADASSRPTLHVEIARILRGSGDWMTTSELAAAVNAAGRYRKRDGSPVIPLQIHGRTRNYTAWFERNGTQVRLRPDAPK